MKLSEKKRIARICAGRVFLKCKGCGAQTRDHWIPVSLEDIHNGSGFRFSCRPGVKFDMNLREVAE